MTISITSGFLLSAAPAARHGTFRVFGPKDYVRGKHKPAPVTDRFTIRNPQTAYFLRIVNGGRDGQFGRVSSAVVRLNGVKVITPDDFRRHHEARDRGRHGDRGRAGDRHGDQSHEHGRDDDRDGTPGTIVKRVVLAVHNTLVVEISGAPRSGMTLEIEGIDNDPPAIGISSPANGATLDAAIVAVSGTVTDALSGVAGVTCNGIAAAVSGSTFTCQVPLKQGANQVLVRAKDVAGNEGAATITVIRGSAITLAIANPSAPATVPVGAPAAVEFDYTDPEGDIVSLEVTATNALGLESASLPAASLGILGKAGHASMPLASDDRVFGDNTFTLQLKDGAGHTSNPVTFTVKVVGDATGGTAPVLQNLTTSAAWWNRPAGAIDRLRPLFTFSYLDPDGDIRLLRRRLIRPDGSITASENSAEAEDIEGSSGTVARSFFTFGAADPLGVYHLELTLIDRGGNQSDIASALIELVAAGGQPPPFISGFSPQQGAAGTSVTLAGGGFDTAVPPRVELAGAPADIVSAIGSAIVVIVPEHAGSGRFVVRTQNGVAASDGTFVVPPSVAVSPQAPEIVVGSALQFTAATFSTSASAVEWKVNGVPGGNATVGLIGAQGRYSAPPAIPPGGRVTVSASLISDPSIGDSTEITILPPPARPGRAAIVAALGGRVFSADGRAAVSVPPGALGADVEITVATLYEGTMPPPRPERRIVGAVRLGPSPLAFNAPVTVTVPLTRYYTPGTRLALRLFDESAATYSDHGTATVAANGEQAIGSIPHFSDAVVDDSEPLVEVQATCQSLISISDLTAAGPFQEGLKVPVRLTGTGLTSDLHARIVAHAGGRPDDVLPGALYTLDRTGALVLDIQTIRDLGVGSDNHPQTRAYTLRLERPGQGCQFAEKTFVVEGLDEFDPANPQPGRYSEITVPDDVTLSIPIGGMTLESTGPVSIFGRINGSGSRGESAPGQRCGGLPPGQDEDVCGRDLYPPDGRGGLGREDTDLHRRNLGATGSLFDDVDVGPGAGGQAGSNIDLASIQEDIAAVIVSAIGCFTVDQAACVTLVRDIIEAGNTIVDATGGPSGRPGFGGKRAGTGGGGGGAGFFSTPWVPLPPPISTLASLRLLGGGGGQGGGAAQPFSVVTPDTIQLGRDSNACADPGAVCHGQVTTAGGNGGDGSASGQIKLALKLRPDLTIPVSVPTFRGGGGGGGGGSTLTLASGTALAFSNAPLAQAASAGGSGGTGGSSTRANGNPGTRNLADPTHARGSYHIFDPVTLETSATNRSVIPVRVASPAAADITIRVEGENNQRRDTIATRGADLIHTANLVLFPGFNTICVSNGTACDAHMPHSYQLLHKRVLSVFTDSDGDSISDADEVAFGTDPNDSDSDHDGVTDGLEVTLRTDPLDPDTDHDGLTDGDEGTRHTNPLDFDSDDDGVSDGVEVALLSDPLLATSRPALVPAGTLFGQNGNDLVVVDAATGSSAVLGHPVFFGFGLAFDAAATLLIADDTILRRFDPLTGARADVGPFGAPGGDQIHVARLAFNPQDAMLYGVEFGAHDGHLVRIDPATGAAARIGAAGSPAIVHALAFTPAGVLYATVYGDASSDRLVEISPLTGDIVRDIGAVGHPAVFGLTFGPGGVLLASTNVSNVESRLLTIDVNTGAGIAGATVARPLYGLTAAPCPAPCFTSVNLGVSDLILKVAAEDVTGDTRKDIVGIDRGHSRVVLLPGKGDGTFHPLRTFATLPEPTSLAVADVNHDGAKDVIIGHSSSRTVSVWLNNGAGDFLAAGTYTVGVAPLSLRSGVVVGDLTNDGHPDIAAGVGAGVVVLINDGTAHFTAHIPVTGGSPFGGNSIALGNLDGDTSIGAGGVLRENLDVVIAHSDGHVTVFFGDGTGNFPRVADYPFALFAVDVAVGDVNGDGKPDVAVTDGEAHSVRIALNDGSGALVPGVPYQIRHPLNPDVPMFPNAVSIADLTGDNTPDLAMAVDSNNSGRLLRNVTVLVGDGHGGFAPARRSPFPVSSPTHLAVGDFDGDGRVDVVVGGSLTVLLNKSPF